MGLIYLHIEFFKVTERHGVRCKISTRRYLGTYASQSQVGMYIQEEKKT